jgi:NADPH2 dehydrogenase
LADLSSPLAAAGLTLKNRIIMPPMANNKADEGGRVTDVIVEHYAARAAGGPGMIIVEHSYVIPTGRVDVHQLGIWRDDLVPGLRRVAEAIHAGGAAAIIQITHAGARSPSAATGRQAVAPSDVRVPGDAEDPRPMTSEEIAEMPGLFAAAAQRAIDAGFDGVEVHGAHGYLLNEFMSPYTNRRDDEYGGSLEGRLRLPQEVVRAVRAAVGPAKAVLYRFCAEDGVEGGLTSSDAAGIAPSLVEWGIDLIDCSGGLCGSRPATRTDPGFFIEPAAAVKRAVTVPVSGVGGIVDAAFADSLVRDGSVDAVCVGRAQLKDPEWARKALAELGHRM